MEIREVWKNLINSILKMDKFHLSKFHFIMISYMYSFLSIHTIKTFQSVPQSNLNYQSLIYFPLNYTILDLPGLHKQPHTLPKYRPT